MIFPLGFALVALVPTLVLAAIWAIVLRLRSRAAKPFLARAAWAHLWLFFVHALFTFPLLLGWWGSRGLGTRGDESSYEGPRIAADGVWSLQDSRMLRAERSAPPPAEVVAASRRLAVTLPGVDGVTLRAYRVPSKKSPPTATVVLVHGLFRSALELEAPASMFRDLGCDCWIVEQRNHGRSGRAPATFGLRESDDLVAAVREIREVHGARAPLVLFGVSLGSAAVSLAAPRIEGLAGLVLDAPIEDLLAAAHRMLGLQRRDDGRRWFALWEPWRSLVLASVESWSDVPLADVQPARALRGLPSTLPVLLVGGENDDKSPQDVVRALFESLPMLDGDKELWIAEGAGHGDAWKLAPADYKARLRSLLQRALRTAPR